MAHFCPESTHINYECGKCPVSNDKTVKLWRLSLDWNANRGLTCRECTELKESKKLEDHKGVRIGISVPAIPFKTNDDDNNEDDVFVFRVFGRAIGTRQLGYSQWADLPEK